jgi:hypothetical protein
MLDINSISPNLRDNLLNRNLILSEYITKNNLSGFAQGLGYTTQIGSDNPAVKQQKNVEEIGDIEREKLTNKNSYKPNGDYEKVTITTNTNVFNPKNEPYVKPNPNDSDLIKKSENFRKNNTIKNQYDDVDGQTLFNVENKTAVLKQSKNYLDDIKSYQKSIGETNTMLNVIGSVLRGQGVGIDAQGGLNPGFDFRTSLIGRSISGYNDTPLGKIANEQLKLAFLNNVIFNAQQETIGNINLNPFDLATSPNPTIFRPNFDITVPKGKLGKSLDFAGKILGVESPISLIGAEASIFHKENPVSNITRNNSLIKYTGKGQKLALFRLINENEYRPPYEDDRVLRGINRADGIVPNLYVDVNKIQIHEAIKVDGEFEFNTPPLSFADEFDNLDNKNENYFNKKNDKVFEGGNTNFIWTDNKLNKKPRELGVFDGNEFSIKKSLLFKTQKLFNSGNMKTLTTGKGELVGGVTEIQTAVNRGFISKGSGVLSKGGLLGTANNPENVFCRVWSTIDRYNQVQNLQKHSGLTENIAIRRNTKDSVLQDNGFVKIEPYASDAIENADKDNKKYMFSIENLAWANDISSLSPLEIGYGDKTTGTRGRIMWFPPYDISFNESTSVDWESTRFIGRGEPVYTYNNTERSGTLSFKIIIDHATYINDLKDTTLIDDYVVDNDLFAAIAAGCVDDIDFGGINTISDVIKNEIEVEMAQEPDSVSADENRQKPPNPFQVYFPNDVAAVPDNDSPPSKSGLGLSNGQWDGYENNVSGPANGLGRTKSEKYHGINGKTNDYPDETNFGLNSETYEFDFDGNIILTTGWTDPNFKTQMKSYLTEVCPACKINIGGFASTDGKTPNNSILSEARAKQIEDWFIRNIFDGLDVVDRNKRFGRVVGYGEMPTCPPCDTPLRGCQDDFCRKSSRAVNVKFEYSPEIDNIIKPKPKVKSETQINEERRLSNKVKSLMFDESRYFKKLEQTDKFVFDKIREKIQFFHPAFHSMTPEGFNARLNFLHQCTRQGSTNVDEREETLKPSNMAFGVAPVCILRLGDFYHTKIIITSMNLDFEPLLWDLNPEGVGVQPMICNVNLNFNFIGGSALKGAINKLQNAVSFNYFANTEIYDSRADVLTKKDDSWVIEEGVSPFNVKNDDETEESQQTGVAGNPKLENNQVAELENNELVENEDNTPKSESAVAFSELDECEILTFNYFKGTKKIPEEIIFTLGKPDGSSFDAPELINFKVEYKTNIGIGGLLGGGTIKANQDGVYSLVPTDEFGGISETSGNNKKITVNNPIVFSDLRFQHDIKKINPNTQFLFKITLGNNQVVKSLSKLGSEFT